MRKRGFRAIRSIVSVCIAIILLTACAPKQSGNHDFSVPAILDNCKAAVTEYASSEDGLVVFSEGSYFAVFGGQLYNAQTVEAHTFEGAGETILPAVAAFREIPYIENGQTAKACNYYLTVNVAGTTHQINFYADCSAGQKPQFITLYDKNNVQISKGVIGQITAQNTATQPIKNVIYMIADGGGYDNFTLADNVKEALIEKGANKLVGAKTEVTTNLLADLGKPTTNGLYLDELLVGSANTLLTVPHGDADNYKSYITDSSAAGTALSSGYKTTYCYAGVDSDGNPRASLPELARMNGMSTGLVTTKSYVDATPLAFFTSHAIHRYEYQDNSLQALLSGIDVVIAEGTEFGDLCESNDPFTSSHPDVSASSMGYTVARNKSELLEKARTAKKLWAPILGVDKTYKDLKTDNIDLAADHISYDVDALPEQPSLLEMTKAALQVLENANNPEGFFLMIEGGALDNAAESGHLRPTIGEYLAFDEAFGYCVDWAAERNDTIVIAVPDHDSGGFSGIEGCKTTLIDSIISGKIGNEDFASVMKFEKIVNALDAIGADTSMMEIHGGHTDMPVPISLYAPETIRETLLKNMGLPTATGDVRTGNQAYYVENAHNSYTWYASSALNQDYVIDNTQIAPAIAETLALGSFDDATEILFQKVGHIGDTFTGDYGGTITADDSTYHTNDYAVYCHMRYTNDEKNLLVDRNATKFHYADTAYENGKIGKQQLTPIFVLDERKQAESGTFYAPYTILTTAKLGWSVTISDSTCGFDRVLYEKGTGNIVLPNAPTGKQVIYTDGLQVYAPGDTLTYNGENIMLTAYTK